MTDYSNMSLHEELETRFADEERRRQEEEFLSRGWQPPARWQRVGQGLKHDLEDIGYGMKKALSGATLGASDWALRKLGVTDDDYLAEREAEGLGNTVKGADRTQDNEDERVNGILQNFLDNVNQINFGYRIGDVAGTLAAAKEEMDTVRKNGYDNYAHRLGMCLNGQKGIDSAIYSLGGGILKEASDLYSKSVRGNMPWREALSDSYKDMKNNIEGLKYGLQNPDKSCRVWLNDLDYGVNKWKR